MSQDGLGRWARKELNPFLIDDVGWEGKKRKDDEGFMGFVEDEDEKSDATKIYDPIDSESDDSIDESSRPTSLFNLFGDEVVD